MVSSTKNQCTTLIKKIMLFRYVINYIYMFLMNILDKLLAVLKFEKRDGYGGYRSLYKNTREPFSYALILEI